MLGQKTIENLHAEIGGGYTMGRKIIVDAAEIMPGEVEVMALYDGGDEIETKIALNIDEAREIFLDMVKRYAEPLQASFIAANMKPGERYTIFHLGHDFGFPIMQKFTYEGMELTTYAQHKDAVKLLFRPYKKRTLYEKYFYNQSFIICKGWHDLDETKTKDTLTDRPGWKTTITKYACFDARYIEDAKSYLPDIVAIHDEYKTGVNGKLYA
jgi:hypothetical protein